MKQKWTAEEQHKFSQLMKIHGMKFEHYMPEMPNRNIKQIRARYYNQIAKEKRTDLPSLELSQKSPKKESKSKKESKKQQKDNFTMPPIVELKLEKLKNSIGGSEKLVGRVKTVDQDGFMYFE
uniref:HTH myb-type domain-containing protein n=1 Tax=Trepomonas sp. PC1 TaxID=1076344 RepID=A0A146KHM3_9EUKA|eukprot:JAP94749.1 hypothetical protein TPC1_12492 [Trepomonas sp. PC1]